MTSEGVARPTTELRDTLDRLVASAQIDWKAPAVSAGVVVDGALLWSAHVGSAILEPAEAPTDDTQYLIGSITKTFTAVLVMALRDEGRLDLDEPVSSVLPQLSSRTLTPRRLLAHASGLGREFAGRIWESLDAPDEERLLRELADAEQVLPPHLAFHYSNLAYAALGQVVARLDGGSWESSLHRRILGPLEMVHTGLQPGPTAATGYLVHPHAATAVPEPRLELRAAAPSGGLWSTVADMARYASFVADPVAEVLAPASLEEMTHPVVMSDLDAWTGAYGMGFGLGRYGERVLVGHGGAMPGFLSGLRVKRGDKVGAVVFANSSAGAEPLDLAASLTLAVLDAQPTPQAPWTPSQPHPELEGVLGTWWTEGAEIVFEVRQDQLWSRVPADPHPGGDTRFEPVEPDVFVAVQGRERGERLEVVRDASGGVARMYFVGYPVTPKPVPSDSVSSSEIRPGAPRA